MERNVWQRQHRGGNTLRTHVGKYGILQTKQYTLQGYNNGMSFFYTNLSKSILKDKLALSLNFVTPLADKLKVGNRIHGADYTQKMEVRVPIRQLGLTLTYKFGNSKKQFTQKESNIKNDFKEQQTGMSGLGNIGSSKQ